MWWLRSGLERSRIGGLVFERGGAGLTDGRRKAWVSQTRWNGEVL